MDYSTSSRSQKKPSPTGSISSSSRSSPPTTESASLRYLRALTNSSEPYESPYAQDIDKRLQPPTGTALRASTLSTATRFTSGEPSYQTISPLVQESLSTYSSSSGGSLYNSLSSRQRQKDVTPGKMSSSRTMSSVSHFSYCLVD